jgi:hypothetical protein
MKVAFALTMDGLVRALRGAAHGLAEEAEGGYFRGAVEPSASLRQAQEGVARQAHHEGDGDDERSR